MKPVGRLKAYLDTSVVSRFADGKLDPTDLAALAEIKLGQQTGSVDLYISDLVGREISEIPQRYRAPYALVLQLLENIPLAPSHIRTPPFGPRDFPFGVRPNALLMRLSSVLPDEPDAGHVFQAAMNGLQYVITFDVKTMVRHAVAVAQVWPVQIVTPAAFACVLAQSVRETKGA
jgi:hypothetical protein